jgi:3-methylcrotonyl-CoA carboxylase beta subunit
MHTSVSGVADYLAQNDGHAIRLAREAVKDLGGDSGNKRKPVSYC